MSDLLLMSPPGLPRNGLVGLYDPYRDAYGLDEAGRAALQTGVDYSGRGNTLTYGATTGASTDDPTNTGTAWSFDGGDYLWSALDGKQSTFTRGIVFKDSLGGASAMALFGRWGGSAATRTAVVFVVTATKIQLSTSDGSSAQKNCNVTIPSIGTGWHHLIWTLTGGAGQVCLDGVLYAVTGLDSVINPNPITSKYRIGAVQEDTGLIQYPLTGEVAYYYTLNNFWGSSTLMRVHNSIKSLMARRGVTLA